MSDCRIERTSLGGGVICASCGDDCQCVVCLPQGEYAIMLCSTAGLTRGQEVKVLHIDEPFVTVLDAAGNEHLVLVGDIEEAQA